MRLIAGMTVAARDANRWRRRFGLSWIGVAVLLLVWQGCRHDSEAGAGDSLPAIRPAPEFSCTSADGRVVTNAAFRDKVTIAFFFFTSCGGPCPAMNANAAELQREFAGLSDFRIAAFTVDPDTDTPERLSAYAAHYGAMKDRWYFLRGGSEATAELASKGFLMGDPSTPAMHSTRYALIDRKGMIRGYFDGLDPERLEALRAAIRSLEAEART